MGAALSPVVAQKELAELEWLSLLLAGSIVIFIVMSLVLLLIPSFPSTAPTFKSLILPDERWVTIESFCTIMVAYSYQFNVFPVYDSLKEQTQKEYSKAQTRALLFSIAVYYAIALLGIFLFGEHVQSSILLSFGDPSYYNPKTGKPYWQATVIQFAFLIVLLCHIPFIFFGGKEALCILVDELKRRSISNVLWAKIHGNKEHTRMTTAGLNETDELNSPCPNPDLPLPFELEFEKRNTMVDPSKSMTNQEIKQ